MPNRSEKNSTDDSLPLTKEHPAYKKVAEKIHELEADGVAPTDEEYITEVAKFVRAEPALANELAKENVYLEDVIAHINSGHEEPTAVETESEPIIEKAHAEAFQIAQEMSLYCNKLAIELKNRSDRGLTPLFDEQGLKALYHSGQSFTDALASNNTERAVELIHVLVRAISALEKGHTSGVNEDTDSLKKLGFYIREFGEHSTHLARVYGEIDTPEAIELSANALRLKEVADQKLDLLARMIRVLSDY